MPMYTSMGQQRMGWYGWNNEYEEVTTAVITTRIPSGNFARTTVKLHQGIAFTDLPS